MFLLSDMDLHELAIELFCRFDPDKKGYITQDQLLNGSIQDNTLSEGQIMSVFTLLDKEEKGIITLSDFTDAFLDISVVDGMKTTRGIKEYPVFTGDDAIEHVAKSRNKVTIHGKDSDCMNCPCGESISCHSKLKVRCCVHDKSLKHRVSSETLDNIFNMKSSDEGDHEAHINNKRLFGLRKFSVKRRASYPTVIDRKRVESSTTNFLLKLRQWKSFEGGIDKFCTNGGKVVQNNSFTENIRPSTKTSFHDSEIKNKGFSSHKIMYSDYPCREEVNLKEINISKELDEIFGSTDKIRKSVKSCGMCNENRSMLSTDKTEKTSTLNVLPSDKLGQVRDLLSVVSKSKKINSPKKNGYCSVNHENKIKEKELFLSHGEEVDSNSDDFLEEEWENYLRRIGGISLLSGNFTLQYLWHQIKLYQPDLLFSFDKFLRGIIEEQRIIYSSYQELENTLHLKIEQHEQEISNLYEEFDIARELEFKDLYKKQNEREEYMKNEFRKIIEYKEQAYQECCKQKADINERQELYEEEMSSLHASKKKCEEQIKILSKDQSRYLAENQQLLHENEMLRMNYKASHSHALELQEQINLLKEAAAAEKSKHQSFLQQYNDIIDEKTFLETSLVNLTVENKELRYFNKSATSYGVDNNENLSMEISDLPLSSSSPIKSKHPCNSYQLMSLQEEMNMSFGRKLSPQVSYDEVIQKVGNSNKKEKEKRLHPNTFKITHHFIKCDKLEISNSETETIANKLVSNYYDSASLSVEEKNCGRIKSYNIIEPKEIQLAAPCHTNFKVIICGDSNVGKTSLICRICCGTFNSIHQRTQNVDTYTTVIENGGHNIKLKLWDTVGQERYSILPTSYYRKSDVAIVMYDVCVEKSFRNIKMWISNIQKFNEDLVIVIVGGKIDLGNLKRNISKEKGESFAKENGAIFMETSSKTGENVQRLMNSIAVALCFQNEFVMIQNYFEQSSCHTDTSRGKLCCN